MKKNYIKKIIKKIINSIGYNISKIDKTSIIFDKNADFFIKKLLMDYKKNNLVKIHFGCGPRIIKGWINIDLSFEPYENYLKYYTDKYYPEKIRGDKNDFYAIDITKKGLPLPDNSVDIIFHEDFLEHINQKDQIIFLSETLRILKKGGIHRVNTPNLLTSMKDHSDFTKGYNGVYIYEWDKHKDLNVLTPDMLKEMAITVGYSKIFFNTRNKSLSNEIPLEYRPADDRTEDGNIFADLIK